MVKKTKFGLGLLIGAAGATAAGLFLTSKKGKQLKKDTEKKLKELKKKLNETEVEKKAKKIFGKATKETKELYVKASSALLEKMADLKKRAGRVDANRYKNLVSDVLEDLKKSGSHSAKTLKLFGENLAADWQLFTKDTTKKPNSKKKN